MNFGVFVRMYMCVCVCFCVFVCVCVCMLCTCMYVCITLLSVTLASGQLPILLKTDSIMHIKPRQGQLANREGTV